MQQLTGLDTAFLAIESPTTYGHVNGLMTFAPDDDGNTLTVEALRELISARIHQLPPLRRRLAQVPLGLDNPYWVDDPDFDIEYHVREIALPAPGTDEQLAEQVARIVARHLDVRRPLWEAYLIEGLEGGGFALLLKLHHASIDGVSGEVLLSLILDPTPEGREIPGPTKAWKPRPMPSESEMLLRGVKGLATHPFRVVRAARRGLVPSLGSLAAGDGGWFPGLHMLPVVGPLVRRGREDGLLSKPRGAAPPTPFNGPITAHRRVAFATLPLADVKTVKNAFGCTVNDVVMATCAGGLRHWLIDHHALPDDPLLAGVPISVRKPEDRDKFGNHVSGMVGILPTHLADPVERLRCASDAMKVAKDQHKAVPATLMQDMAQFSPPAVLGLAARTMALARIMNKLLPFNLVISNVPGSPTPIYLGGYRQLAYYPVSTVLEGSGLNITVLSYVDGLGIALIADREMVPDTWALLEHLRASLDELLSAAKAL